MNRFRRHFRAALLGLAIALCVVPPASLAGPDQRISTAEMVDQRVIADQRAEILETLQREEVEQALEQRGVDPEVVEERVARMSDAEVQELAAELDELPAGGNSVVSAAVFVFVVLLVTDLLGLTDVFPFTR